MEELHGPRDLPVQIPFPLGGVTGWGTLFRKGARPPSCRGRRPFRPRPRDGFLDGRLTDTTMVTPSGTVVLYPIDAPPIDGAPGPIDAITTTLGYNPPVILKAPDLKRKTGRTWSGPCERSMPLL